ncbi:PREDICTED: uncharacterized protein LOC108776343 [Cyphomyrmex costatus]|uniref:uncharacterized protein LOC108776343 n=1 Tax=Cyphomyrmex costatus TaxID=456900 RepID=UPI0008524451|nr:PREDICTED: uncharacterized protein LOC108776343 [Cyphomyrmex costatus]
MIENNAGLAIISEPHRVLDHPYWLSDKREDVAICWRKDSHPMAFSLICAGEGYLTIKWGEIFVTGVYCSPNVSKATFKEWLDDLGQHIQGHLDKHILLCGDFNARSSLWGDRITNARGRILEEWSASFGLVCANRGSRGTCVRSRGESIVDTSWISFNMNNRVADCRVLSDETMSDHRYISIKIGLSAAHRSKSQVNERRWAVRKLNKDLLTAVFEVLTWKPAQEAQETDNVIKDLDAETIRLQDIVATACDVAIPRTKSRSKKQVHW